MALMAPMGKPRSSSVLNTVELGQSEQANGSLECTRKSQKRWHGRAACSWIEVTFFFEFELFGIGPLAPFLARHQAEMGWPFPFERRKSLG